MEKVKLTREQFEALELYKSNTGKGLGWMQYFVEYGHEFSNSYLPLKGFTFDEFARLLYVPDSYEVEEEYKVGDWVVDTRDYGIDSDLIIGQLYENAVGDFDVDRAEKTGMSFYTPNWRHATPEEIKAEQERRVWKGIGRVPGEFQFQDIVTFLDNENYIVTDYTNTGAGVVSKKYAYEAYKGGNLSGFFPRESFISFGGGEE